jgi:hypothetical protein
MGSIDPALHGTDGDDARFIGKDASRQNPETLNRIREIDIPMSESPEAPEIEKACIHIAGCGVTTENPLDTGQMTRPRKRVIEVRKD